MLKLRLGGDGAEHGASVLFSSESGAALPTDAAASNTWDTLCPFVSAPAPSSAAADHTHIWDIASLFLASLYFPRGGAASGTGQALPEGPAGSVAGVGSRD